MLMKRYACLVALLCMLMPGIIQAQNLVISGNVKNASGGEAIGSVSVTLKDGTSGTFTDNKGNFRLVLPSGSKFPVTLVLSSIGFGLTEIKVESAGDLKTISLKPSSTLGEEVVVSATRTPTRIIESPVSIERLGNAALRNASSADYYDMALNLKGVDMVAS